MPTPSPSPVLDEFLQLVARRYRLQANTAGLVQGRDPSSATALALVIEQARQAVERDETPDAPLRQLFVESLAQLIRDAMHAEGGDPAFQAMVLRHRFASVREYASLSARSDQDRRSVYAAVNTIAHPAKLERIAAEQQRNALADLHGLASSASWSKLCDAAERLLPMPEIANEPALERSLAQLRDSPALGRLCRLEILASDKLVQHYQSLWDRNGPRPGSDTAQAQGSDSRRRGAAVEALAAQAIEGVANRLNEIEGPGASYKVVTSMRVPSSIPANPERAKSEWDVVLLRQAKTDDAPHAWDVCLLVEAKASVEAAATDFPRLLRGLRLLAHADENVVYPFQTREGIVPLRGASLSALTTDETSVRRTVLYCCDAPADEAPRLLNAASRMQLLSAPAALEFAGALTEKQDANPQGLEQIWRQLLEAPQWRAVLHQYTTLRQVRELMVHAEDLSAAINAHNERY